MNYRPLPAADCAFCDVALPARWPERQRYCTPRHAQKALRHALVSTANGTKRSLTLTIFGHVAAMEIRRRRDAVLHTAQPQEAPA